ncbi:NOL1/NOP2/sun family putative RNA methylase domain protein [Candida albicans]|uniref:Nucleolar protein 2 n=1 Tax=Candida albicans TaxID=5476 RepID=A0A8H6BVN9_CANAX|nr:NOL1/NOP2/sun family putative RNA methylase domain protein [Candida albicans]
MGRRAKNKQGVPPTFDEFQASKLKNDTKRKRNGAKEQKNDLPVSKKPKSSTSSSKQTDRTESSKPKPKTKSKVTKDVEVEEEVENLPEVDLEELASAKKSLFDDSEEEELDDEFDVEDDEDEDLEDLNAENMELYSKRLDEEERLEAEEAEKELLEAETKQPRAKVLPTAEEEEEMAKGPQDVTMVRTRMLEVVKVLENFKELAEEGTSRTDYTNRLLKDICEYFGYSEFLADKLFNLFSPAEAMEFFEANEIARPITIRTNTLKTRRRDLAQALVNKGVNLQPIGSWTKVGLQIFDSQVPIGATPEYLAGQYILQAASSFLPVMALEPQENERILDMAAAPGGKTTYISALMKNTGCVFANDANKARTKSLIANIHRLGCKNTIVCNYDAREFPKVIGGFDRVLLDAPCSGTGVIAKDESVKVSRTEKDFMQIPHLQKQLLLSAIDSVDAHHLQGAVVDYALRKRPNVKLVDTGLTIGKEGFTSYRGKHFNPKISLTRRYYPHTYNVDGFYVAKFKKIAPSPHDISKAGAKEKENAARAEAEEEGIIHGDFAEFDDEEDKEIMEKSKKHSLRKKGINPNATKK